MPLSPAEVLLLVAVKGVPSLRKLDTNPEIPMPAADNLEHFKTFRDERVLIQPAMTITPTVRMTEALLNLMKNTILYAVLCSRIRARS